MDQHPALLFSAPPCSLYVAVITTIRGYGDVLWVDVVERVDAMGSQVVGWAEGRGRGLPLVAPAPAGFLPHAAANRSSWRLTCSPRPPLPPAQVNEFQHQCKKHC